MCELLCMFFFFFMQKTAYEMRISDWSSDVCSSDLLVDIGHRDSQADEDMGAITRLAEQEAGAPGNHFLAEADKRRDQLLDIQQLRLAGIQRQHVDAKRRLQRREVGEIGRASCRDRVGTYV